MDLITKLITDAHFWVGAAFVVFLGVLVWAGIHKLAWKTLGDAGDKVRSQLAEAEALRAEAESLLADVRKQKDNSDRLAAEMLANAKEEAQRLQVEARAKLAEQIERRGVLAERRIATAEAQATADVKAAAADLAAQMAEQVLVGRLAGAKSDPLVDRAISQLGGKLQ